METYWDQFLKLLQEGRIMTRLGGNTSRLEYLSPINLLECFFWWLVDRGIVKKEEESS